MSGINSKVDIANKSEGWCHARVSECNETRRRTKLKNSMFYVYILRSTVQTDRMYVGYTSDLEHRLKDHNYGKSEHTKKYAPWELMTYISFDSSEKAIAFEKYLKSGSGRAFSKRHF